MSQSHDSIESYFKLRDDTRKKAATTTSRSSSPSASDCSESQWIRKLREYMDDFGPDVVRDVLSLSSKIRSAGETVRTGWVMHLTTILSISNDL